MDELRKLLETTEDKLGIFGNKDLLNEYISKYNLKISEVFDMMDEFLSDADKLKVLGYEHFLKGPMVKRLLGSVSDANVLVAALNNDRITDTLTNMDIRDFIVNLDDNGKKIVLTDEKFIGDIEKTHNLIMYDFEYIFENLGDKLKIEWLSNKEFVTQKIKFSTFTVQSLIEKANDNVKKELIFSGKIENWRNEAGFDIDIASVIDSISDEEIKIEIVKNEGLVKDKFGISNDKITKIIKNGMNDSNKLNFIFEDARFSKDDRIELISSLSTEALCDFLINNKKFCLENDIKPYEIVRKLDVEQQLKFVVNLEGINLMQNERLEILASLKNDTKAQMDKSSFSKEDKAALSIETDEDGNAIVDLEKDSDRNLEDYKGLDRLIFLNPEEYNEEKRSRLMMLCDVCPDLKVMNTLYGNGIKAGCYLSSGKEYKEGEEWILNLINEFKPEYSDLQKIAIIDNAIGRRISYSQDFEADEIFSKIDCRALWKIISSGYGVCNGIANIEKYIFDRIGVESEFANSKTHCFLKLNNIEIPCENGEIKKGSTILDPTWDLTAHRFGAKPDYFLKSYEDIRQYDKLSDGTDCESHKNDELIDATLSIGDKALRELYSSVNLANKDGKFTRYQYLMEKSKALHEQYGNQPEENIKKHFELLSEVCPDFEKHQAEAMYVIQTQLFKDENFKFNRCIAKRVYDKSDENKAPVMYVYIDKDELGRKFYVADKESGQFVEVPQNEFSERYECYNNDLVDGKWRPWEIEKEKQEDKARTPGAIGEGDSTENKKKKQREGDEEER